MEYRLRRSDGAFRWIFDRGVPFNGTSGKFGGYIGSCIDVTERVEAQAQLKATQEAEINTLRGLLPICSGCKKIRDGENYWHHVETYVMKHSDAHFTHGICPDCLKKYYPGIEL